MAKDKKQKKALIFGVTGQDGSYLAELLLHKGYEVWGIQRRSSSFNTARIDHVYDKSAYPGFRTLYGDLSDGSNISRLIEKIEPDEIYNLAAQSHVMVSFDVPEYTADVTGLGALRILDAIKDTRAHIKYYQASSSEMFGNPVTPPPFNEETQFSPQSPYACAKVFAYHATRHYREAYGIFTSNGILFNHESERRGETFVTRKITQGLARIKLGFQDKLLLGNLDTKRDWGYAPEYVEAMYLMLQHRKPDDFVIATGETHSIREFVELAARLLGMKIAWKGKGMSEIGIDQKTGRTVIEVSPKYYRPADPVVLLGDYSKARKLLGWKPKTKFAGLVKKMINHDMLDLAQKPPKQKTRVFKPTSA